MLGCKFFFVSASYSLESHEEWCGNYVILHHANVIFSLLMTIFDDIKVVPL